MKLNKENLQNKKAWEQMEISIPTFNVDKVTSNTINTPKWIHFGAGNIFRALLANIQQSLLEKEIEDTGIIVIEGFDHDIIEEINRPHDNLSLLVTLKSDGKIEKKVIASVVDSFVLDREKKEEFSKIEEFFSSSSLQMVSFTITEKGYNFKDSNGKIFPNISEDIKNGPYLAKSYLGYIASLCYKRFKEGKFPLALVSMDNCSYNGDKLKEAIFFFADEWFKNSLVEENFCDYLKSDKISFPLTMIDKITPRPDTTVQKMLSEIGFESTSIEVTSKNTFIAPYVNAEELQYLVIEDDFPNGRPAIDKEGVIFTDRETVNKVEKMKVCTCLNPLHTTLAIFGCLLSFELISEEIKDSTLKLLVEKIGYVEGLPVVADPGIINPKQFLDEVLLVRMPNPFMPDSPWRIATDTSLKLSIRFGETIKSYRDNENLSTSSLKYIPLVLAGWCRYLMEVDDNGIPFKISSDPNSENILGYFKNMNLGDKGSFHEQLYPLLSDETIFGVNLYEVGLGKIVEKYFEEFISGIGAVKNTLEKYLK